MKKYFIVLPLLIFSLTACNSNSDSEVASVGTSSVNSTEYSVEQTTSKAEINSTEKKVTENPVVETTLDYVIFPENLRWNMSLAELKDTETRTLDTKHSFESRNPAFLNYKSDKDTDRYYDSVSIVYCFQDNKLKARWCDFTPEKISNYQDVYNQIKEVLTLKYGECESENIVWTDTTYKDDLSKWNDAFKYGYVTIKTIWHTDDSAIIITWDYNNGLHAAISSLDYEEQL